MAMSINLVGDEVSFGEARKAHTACLSIILVKEVTLQQASQLVVQVTIACLKELSHALF